MNDDQRVFLSMTSALGFLLLVGTVVNNGILYVDTTNEYKKTMSVRDALILTGKTRLRPILMTTLTTILSMIPTALAIGDGGEMMQGLAIVVIGGLTASTFLTLLLLPTFYLILSGKGKKKKKAKHTLEEDQKELDLPETEQPMLVQAMASSETPIEEMQSTSLLENKDGRKED